MSFWDTWINPSPDEIAELYAFGRWNLTNSLIPPGWRNNVPNNWINDTNIDWTVLPPSQRYKKEYYNEAKAKSSIKTEAISFATSMGTWNGKTANYLPINLFSDYFTGTVSFVTVGPQNHVVDIRNGKIKSWTIT